MPPLAAGDEGGEKSLDGANPTFETMQTVIIAMVVARN
jgi:hypothetical protein